MLVMLQCGQLFTRDCVIRKCVRIGFRSDSLTSKRNSVWGSHFNVSFGIMKTPLYRRVSRQDAAHRLFQCPRSTIVVHHFILKHTGTKTSNMYCETIKSLRRFIKNKRQELLTEGVVLLHDNARSHVSRVTHVKWAKFKR